MVAMAACGIEPWNADSITFLDVAHARADGDDMSDTLVPRDERRLRLDGPIAIDCMQIGVAHAGRSNLDKDLAHPRRRHRNLFDGKRLYQRSDHRRLHGSRHRDLLHFSCERREPLDA
jgi:hypothetical protein